MQEKDLEITTRYIMDENGNKYECNILKEPTTETKTIATYVDMSSIGGGKRKKVTVDEPIWGEIKIIDEDAVKIIEGSRHNRSMKLYLEIPISESIRALFHDLYLKDRLQIDIGAGPEVTKKNNVFEFRYIK